MSRRTILDSTPDGLKRRIGDLERGLADLNRKGTPYPRVDDLEWLRRRLLAFGVGAYRSSAQSIPNVTDTDASFSAVSYDDGGWFDPTTPTRLTAPEPGRYMAQGFINYEPNSTGSRALKIFTDGGAGFTAMNLMAVSSGSQTQISVVGIFDLDAGDTLRLVAFQDSGGSMNTATNGLRMSVTRFGAVPF